MATQADLLGNAQGPTNLNYQEIGLNILFRFLDVLQAAIVIAVGLLVIRYLRRYLQKIQTTHEAQRTALNLLEKLTSGFLVVITITLALKIIGLDLTLIISALTLGLSFGLKDIISNYISGVLILFKSPFEIGDVVKIRSYIGKVERIEFQSTTLKTFDRKEITVYNKDILSQSIVNFSKDLERRIEIRVLVGHGTDLRRALKIFDVILENNSAVLKQPRRTIVFRRFAEFGSEMTLRFWVKRPCNILKVQTDLSIQIQEAFDEVKILSPFGRGVEFNQDIGMAEERKGRLKIFYAEPALAAIALQTNGAVSTTAPINGGAEAAGGAANGAVEVGVAAESKEFADQDEPEEY